MNYRNILNIYINIYIEIKFVHEVCKLKQTNANLQKYFHHPSYTHLSVNLPSKGSEDAEKNWHCKQSSPSDYTFLMAW